MEGWSSGRGRLVKWRRRAVLTEMEGWSNREEGW
jgi:hypothetical protein